MQNALVRAEVQYALQTSIVKVYPNERGADSLHQPHHTVELLESRCSHPSACCWMLSYDDCRSGKIINTGVDKIQQYA